MPLTDVSVQVNVDTVRRTLAVRCKRGENVQIFRIVMLNNAFERVAISPV